MINQTLLISVAAAVIVIAVLFWRSKREERSAREAEEKIRRPTHDVLMREESSERVEPELKTSEPVREEVPGAAPVVQDMPADEPPIYRELEEEEAEEKAREEEKTRPTREVFESPAVPPVDPGVEWVLDISPREGLQFSLGGVKSLELELERLDLPLLVRIWAQSARDGLYYQPGQLSSPARHVVAAMVLANRTASLDAVTASRFFQVLEQSAAQNDVDVRRAMEPADAVALSGNLKGLVEYFDRQMEVFIRPLGEDEEFAYERINEVALASGFTGGSGRWEFRLDPSDHDPVVTLALGSPAGKLLTLAFDIPLASLERGDLKLFFSLANHIANALHAVWTDRSGHPIDAAGALLIEENIASHVVLMAEHGVDTGSDRAKLLFARGA